MTDRPILFSAPMVRALLDRRKTQTRRLLGKLNGKGNISEFGRSDTAGYDWHFRDKDKRWHDVSTERLMELLRWRVGDRLYVREEYSFDHSWTGTKPRDGIPAAPVHYWADGNPIYGDWTKPKPGIHMPRWASRLTLTVTDVRVQRLQEITPADAIAEGIWPPANSMTIDCETRDPRDDFEALWNSINGAGSWDANPWIVALTFTVERQNIDA